MYFPRLKMMMNKDKLKINPICPLTNQVKSVIIESDQITIVVTRFFLCLSTLVVHNPIRFIVGKMPAFSKLLLLGIKCLVHCSGLITVRKWAFCCLNLVLPQPYYWGWVYLTVSPPFNLQSMEKLYD